MLFVRKLSLNKEWLAILTVRTKLPVCSPRATHRRTIQAFQIQEHGS